MISNHGNNSDIIKAIHGESNISSAIPNDTTLGMVASLPGSMTCLPGFRVLVSAAEG